MCSAAVFFCSCARLAAFSFAWVRALPAARFASSAIPFTDSVLKRGVSDGRFSKDEGCERRDSGVEDEVGEFVGFIRVFRLRGEKDMPAPGCSASACVGHRRTPHYTRTCVSAIGRPSPLWAVFNARSAMGNTPWWPSGNVSTPPAAASWPQCASTTRARPSTRTPALCHASVDTQGGGREAILIVVLTPLALTSAAPAQTTNGFAANKTGRRMMPAPSVVSRPSQSLRVRPAVPPRDSR